MHSNRSKLLCSFVLAKLLLGSLAVLGLAVQVQPAYAFSLSLKDVLNSVLAERESRIDLPPPPERLSPKTRTTLTVDEYMGYRRLFEKKQFEMLTREAESLYAAYKKDPAQEWKLTEFFEVFRTYAPEHEQLLDDWVRWSHESFVPYLARAEYYSFKGWAERGTKYAKDTAESQFVKMRGFFDKTKKDLDIVLEKEPRLLPAYILLLGLANASHGYGDEQQIISEAMELFPSSYAMYSTILWARLPQWGGSKEEMGDIIRTAFEKADMNEKLYLLAGKLYLVEIEKLRNEKRYAEALELCEQAIKYGEHSSIYKVMASVLYFSDDQDKALTTINKAISICPTNTSLYHWRTLIQARRDQISDVLADINFAEMLVPGDPSNRELRESASQVYLYLGSKVYDENSAKAIDYYGKAIVLEPCNGKALYNRHAMYSRRADLENAKKDLNSAIECGYRDFKAFLALHYLLAYQEKWHEVIECWDNYLVIDQENGESYLHRAEAFNHLDDTAKALNDYKIACNLGQKEACQFLE